MISNRSEMTPNWLARGQPHHKCACQHSQRHHDPRAPVRLAHGCRICGQGVHAHAECGPCPCHIICRLDHGVTTQMAVKRIGAIKTNAMPKTFSLVGCEFQMARMVRMVSIFNLLISKLVGPKPHP